MIRDPSGAAVSGTQVLARNTATGLGRSTTGDGRGAFALSLLPPGVYELSVEAQGFHDLSKRIVVQTGAATFVNIELSVDVLERVVEALDSLPELRYDWHGVDGVVSRFQNENLPLNGREFFQLAILEPGVTAAPRAGFFTRQFDVSVLGASANPARNTSTRLSISGPRASEQR